MLIAESPDGNYSRRKNAGLMPGRGATRRSGRTWHLDLRHHARWLPDCRQTGSNPFHPSRGLLATNLPVFPRRLQLSVPLGLNLLLMPGEHVLRRDVSDGAVQTHVVVMLYVTLHQTKRIFERQRRPGPNALPFEGFVPTFDLAVRLRVIRRSPHVRHARDANELLEVLSDELRPVVGNDSRSNARILLFGTFQNDFNIGLRHRLPQIPMNQETAVAVQDAAQVVERRANVQVGNIDMPMLVRLRRLFKTRPFF